MRNSKRKNDGNGVEPELDGLRERPVHYDERGCLTVTSVTATEGFTYDYAGRLTRSGSASSPVTYTYDARGNLLTAGTDAYAYTGDRLTTMTRIGIGTVSFTHDILDTFAPILIEYPFCQIDRLHLILQIHLGIDLC